ncbi:hypothetical protein ACOSQ3_029379 [Xanthoceras sorbifolium]
MVCNLLLGCSAAFRPSNLELQEKMNHKSFRCSGCLSCSHSNWIILWVCCSVKHLTCSAIHVLPSLE